MLTLLYTILYPAFIMCNLTKSFFFVIFSKEHTSRSLVPCFVWRKKQELYVLRMFSVFLSKGVPVWKRNN